MITDKVQRDLKRLPADFGNPEWIRGAVQSALLFNFGVAKRTNESKHMVYLLELLFLQSRYGFNSAAAREANHAAVIAMEIRRMAADKTMQPSLITVADLHDIVKEADDRVHTMTRDLARSLLKHMSQSHADGDMSVQVLAESIDSGDFKRFNVLHNALPLRPPPDIDRLNAELLQEFPWMTEITETIIREIRLAGSLGMHAIRLRPLLLAGPPGTGKSRYTRRLSELLGIPRMTIACGGSGDSMSLRGTSKGWSTSRPGVIVDLLQRHTCPQAVVIWDEIDKASPSFTNGRIWDVCLQLIERETSHRFFDEALEAHCDLSWVSHVATANHLTPLPRPLLDRFQVMLAAPPKDEHFDALLTGILDDLVREYRLVDRRLLPSLEAGDRRMLKDACGLNPRLLARAVHRLIADKAAVGCPQLH
jgi:hypothetical protein